MSCAITGGYAIECAESRGGVDVIWVLENSNLYDASGNLTVEYASGTVTTLNKVTGKRFWKIEVPRGTSFTTNGIGGDNKTGTFFYTHSIQFPINSRSATVRNWVQTLMKNRCTFVAKEGDGVYRMYGVEFGLEKQPSEAGSGTAGADRNGYLLNFASEEREDFLVVPANIAATLETPGTA